MLLLAAAAIAASAPADTRRAPLAPVVQARAAVRIVRGERIRFNPHGKQVAPARWTQIRTPVGRQPAQLIEFE